MSRGDHFSGRSDSEANEADNEGSIPFDNRRDGSRAESSEKSQSEQEEQAEDQLSQRPDETQSNHSH